MSFPPGSTVWGQPICARDCPILALAGGGHEFLPMRMCILDNDRRKHWVRVMFMDLGHAPGLRYTTVRNHVQHILAKLEAHSIQEVVARDLLDDAR